MLGKVHHVSHGLLENADNSLSCVQRISNNRPQNVERIREQATNQAHNAMAKLTKPVSQIREIARQNVRNNAKHCAHNIPRWTDNVIPRRGNDITHDAERRTYNSADDVGDCGEDNLRNLLERVKHRLNYTVPRGRNSSRQHIKSAYQNGVNNPRHRSKRGSNNRPPSHDQVLEKLKYGIDDIFPDKRERRPYRFPCHYQSVKYYRSNLLKSLKRSLEEYDDRDNPRFIELSETSCECLPILQHLAPRFNREVLNLNELIAQERQRCEDRGIFTKAQSGGIIGGVTRLQEFKRPRKHFLNAGKRAGDTSDNSLPHTRKRFANLREHRAESGDNPLNTSLELLNNPIPASTNSLSKRLPQRTARLRLCEEQS